jgi:hypothetical protein
VERYAPARYGTLLPPAQQAEPPCSQPVRPATRRTSAVGGGSAAASASSRSFLSRSSSSRAASGAKNFSTSSSWIESLDTKPTLSTRFRSGRLVRCTSPSFAGAADAAAGAPFFSAASTAAGAAAAGFCAIKRGSVGGLG